MTKLNLNQTELSLLNELLWRSESNGNFQNPDKIKVFCGDGDGSDDHWMQPKEDELYNLANKMQYALCKEFANNKGWDNE